MNNKNVLVITNMYPTKKHKSFGIFVKNQVDALKEFNANVDIIAITDPKNRKVNVLLKYLIWVIKTLAYLFTRGKKYDVIHAHYVFPSGFLGLLFKKVFGTRLIVTAHGGDIEKMARKSHRLFLLTKKVLQHADHIIAVGEDLQVQIKRDFLISSEKISIINMGVNRQIFRPMDQQEVRVLCGIGPQEKVVLFVGNLLEQKGLLELIEAIDTVLHKGFSVKLYIIGAEKQESFKQRLNLLINEKKLRTKVVFLGVKEQREIAEWMNAADCLVLPAHMEGFGLVALEAMACGTPVIGTNVGGLRHLLSGNAGIITKVRSYKELAIAIEKVLNSEETRVGLIREGFKKAEENEQRKLLKKVIDVYFPSGG